MESRPSCLLCTLPGTCGAVQHAAHSVVVPNVCFCRMQVLQTAGARDATRGSHLFANSSEVDTCCGFLQHSDVLHSVSSSALMPPLVAAASLQQGHQGGPIVVNAFGQQLGPQCGNLSKCAHEQVILQLLVVFWPHLMIPGIAHCAVHMMCFCSCTLWPRERKLRDLRGSPASSN